VSAAVFETIRVRDGWAPFLSRHADRLAAACRALRLPAPEQPLDRILAPWLGAGDLVVRVEVGGGGVTVNTRAVPPAGALDVVIAATRHASYPYKMVARERFSFALEEAGAAGADDALLLTAEGIVAEGTSWSIFGGTRTGWPHRRSDWGFCPGSLGRECWISSRVSSASASRRS